MFKALPVVFGSRIYLVEIKSVFEIATQYCHHVHCNLSVI